MRAKRTGRRRWGVGILAVLAGLASCAAPEPGRPGIAVRTLSVDADRDGHPEDLLVQATLARVPAGRWTAVASLAGTPRPPAAGTSGDLPAHATPSSERRAREPALTVESGGHAPCTLTFYFRGDDVATLSPGAPHPLRVLLRPAAGTGAPATLRQYDGDVRVATPADFLQTPARVLSAVLAPDAASARVDVLVARAGTLVVQASLVAGVTAVRTGRAEVGASGRQSVRVPMALTSDADLVAKGEPRRLVIEVIRPADSTVLATWDTPLDGAR